MVFIPRTYPRAAGLQSEISKMAVTQIAHLENDYRRQVHMANMDIKKSLREFKHNRAIMKRSVKHYTKKLREYKRAKEYKYYSVLPREIEQNCKHPATPGSDIYEANGKGSDMAAAIFTISGPEPLSHGLNSPASPNTLSGPGHPSHGRNSPANPNTLSGPERPSHGRNSPANPYTLSEPEHSSHGRNSPANPNTLSGPKYPSHGRNSPANPNTVSEPEHPNHGKKGREKPNSLSGPEPLSPGKNNPTNINEDSGPEHPSHAKESRTSPNTVPTPEHPSNDRNSLVSTNKESTTITDGVWNILDGNNNHVTVCRKEGSDHAPDPATNAMCYSERADEKTNREGGILESGSHSPRKSSCEDNSTANPDNASGSLDPKLTRKRRSGVVNHVNIMKLQYRCNMRALFRAVDVLAKVHGVKVSASQERKISDPRRISHERFISQTVVEAVDHPTLPSQYLYNMKYGYSSSGDSPEHKTSEVNAPDTSGSLQCAVDSPHTHRRISRFEPPIIEKRHAHFEKQDKRKLSRNSNNDVCHSPKRPPRSSDPEHDTAHATSAEAKFPPIPRKKSVNRKSREETNVSFPSILTERYIQKKISGEENADVKWKTAFSKLKTVHFIDTTDL